jgi:phage terminase small subunit
VAYPRKPVAAHLADGTFRRDRHGDRWKSEPVATGKPKKPRGLPREGSKLWDKVVPELTSIGVVARIDSTCLAEMCRWYARYREMVDKPELDYRMLVLATMAWKQFSQLAKRFGLTPADRATLKTGGTAADDDPTLMNGG